MKTLRNFTKIKLETSDISFDALSSENTIGALRQISQTLQGSHALTKSQTAADGIRNRCLHILILLLTCHAVFGEIKNGYEKHIRASKESLNILRERLEDANMLPAQRRKIQLTIATLVDHVTYFDLTEALLIQFKTIAPELYAEIDTITDRRGRPVSVYVKFVPVNGTDVQAEGTTYMDQSDYDIDTYQSEYGEFTVSVKIWIVPRALLVLAHEMGHIKYQVPHAARYFEFYKKHYDNTSTASSIGHDFDDPSGKSAIHFERRFQKNYTDFLKISIGKVQNPLVVLARLKKNWSKNTEVL